MTCWGAVLCRSPAFRTSGHFVPKVGWIVNAEYDIIFLTAILIKSLKRKG